MRQFPRMSAAKSCCWPLGEPGQPGFRFCAAEAIVNKPYCPDHAAVVECYALAIGEHLHRHTDLDWQLVTDVFGTDLSLTEGFKGSFVVVPHNLVAGRWMRGETGWVPAVVGHLVRRRNRR